MKSYTIKLTNPVGENAPAHGENAPAHVEASFQTKPSDEDATLVFHLARCCKAPKCGYVTNDTCQCKHGADVCEYAGYLTVEENGASAFGSDVILDKFHAQCVQQGMSIDDELEFIKKHNLDADDLMSKAVYDKDVALIMKVYPHLERTDHLYMGGVQDYIKEAVELTTDTKFYRIIRTLYSGIRCARDAAARDLALREMPPDSESAINGFNEAVCQAASRYAAECKTCRKYLARLAEFYS
jgi:hypothetical protein